MKDKLLEKRALIIGAIANLVMAISGWYFYSLTQSQSLLLDGNFSFIALIIGVVAIYVSYLKSKRNATFPYGHYLYESFFVFFKSMLLLVVIIITLVQNTIKVWRYYQGYEFDAVVFGPIFYYAFAMVLIGLGLYVYYSRTIKKMNAPSPILYVEKKSALLDGVLSLVLGLTFFVISILPSNHQFSFLTVIGDSVLAITISLLFIKTPIKVMKDSFIEIGGGMLQNKQEYKVIIEIIENTVFGELVYEGAFISKAGSSYMAVVYVTGKSGCVYMQEIEKFRVELSQKLIEDHPFTDLEVVLGKPTGSVIS